MSRIACVLTDIGIRFDLRCGRDLQFIFGSLG